MALDAPARLVVPAPAKVNRFLHVTGRRADGYHTLESLFTLVDLADTRRGELAFSSYSCGLSATGHEIVYQLDLPTQLTLDAYVVDKDGVDVDIAILAGSQTSTACVARGDRQAAATVGPGAVFVVVDSKTVANEGEFLLVVHRR